MVRPVTSSDTYPDGRKRMRLSLGLEQFSWTVDGKEEQFSDLLALAGRGDSRVDTLRDQLGRSQAELESVSARFTELAGMIPADIGNLEDRLSGILNAATVEAEEIRAEAHRFAETVQAEAEERAARIVAEAQIEHQQAAELRAEMEARSKQLRADIARLREQASHNAAQLLAEADNRAEEMLAQVQCDVDAQRVAAQAKLEELDQVREKIIAQLKHFYDKFNALERPMEPVNRIRSISLAVPPPDSAATRDAQQADDVDVNQAPLGGVG
jgi:DNA repair exonuclease SbcCD ATPase subunit